MKTLPRIAWFSPLNTGGTPTSSVSAYFTDEVLPVLRKDYHIDLYHDGFGSYRDFPTHHYLRAFEEQRRNPYDFFFYQVEDHRNSNFVRSHLGLIPGIVLFHDFLFTQPGPPPFYQSSWEETVQKFHNRKSEWANRDKMYEFRGPRGYRESGMSLVALFSSQRDRADYLRHIETSLNPSIQEYSFYLPSPVSDFSLRDRSFSRTICFAGSTQIEHRSHKLLEALSLLSEPCNLLWLVDSQEKTRAEELLKEFEIVNGTLIESKSPYKWREIVARSDIAIHTLFSCYGQPAPYLSISLMAGLPCIVTNFGEADFLPNELVFKVDMGESEARALGITLSSLLHDEIKSPLPETQSFAQNVYGVHEVCKALSSIFEQTSGHVSKSMSEWVHLEKDGRAEVIKKISESMTYGGDINNPDPNIAWNILGKEPFQEFGWV